MKTARDQLREICEKFADAGLTTISKTISRLFRDRSPQDNAKWARETRQRAQDDIAESIAEGVHTPLDQPEIDPDDLKSIADLPPIDLGIIQGASDNTEIRALKAAGAIDYQGERISTRDPKAFLFGLVALLGDRTVWAAIQARKKINDLYPEVIEPMQTSILQVLSYDTLLKVACQGSRLYHVPVASVTPEQIYRGAAAFVERASSDGGASRTALTNSTSSGIIDPLERVGTAEIERLLEIPSDSELREKLQKKDEWRVCNFRDGLLNPSFNAHRLYLFDRAATSRALRSTIDLLPPKSAEKYRDLAAQNLHEALSFSNLELREVPQFSPWMARFTRSAPGHVLISLRHVKTKSIIEGVELTFDDPERYHRFYSRMFRLASPLASALGGLGLGLPVILAGFIEDWYFDNMNSRLFSDRVQDSLSKGSALVSMQGRDEREQMLWCRTYVDALVTS